MIGIFAYVIAAVNNPTPGRRSVKAQQNNPNMHRPNTARHRKPRKRKK
jgi:hypothetical protein